MALTIKKSGERRSKLELNGDIQIRAKYEEEIAIKKIKMEK